MAEMRYVGVRTDQELMLAISNNMFEESALLLKMQGKKPKPKPVVARRTDYPPSSGGKPGPPEGFDVLDYIMGKYDFLWWRCGTYTKKQRGQNVWIDSYPHHPEAPGGGHRALRRLGWAAVYRQAAGGFVWVHPTLKELPWAVPARSEE